MNFHKKHIKIISVKSIYSEKLTVCDEEALVLTGSIIGLRYISVVVGGAIVV